MRKYAEYTWLGSLFSPNSDSVAQGEDEEGEADELVNSVLDEIGIDLNGAPFSMPYMQPCTTPVTEH